MIDYLVNKTRKNAFWLQITISNVKKNDSVIYSARITAYNNLTLQ
jgi:hypothetical protein